MPLVVGTNSYVTRDEASEYMSGRVFSELWSDLDGDAQDKYLSTARIYLDYGFVWDGEKIDEEQPTEWPRVGYEAVPAAIKNAQCEIALSLLKNEDDLVEPEVSTKLDRVSVEYRASGIFDPLVVLMLSKYGAEKSSASSVVMVDVLRS